MSEDICEICSKPIEEYDIYHIEDTIGHLECFTKAIRFAMKHKDFKI